MKKVLWLIVCLMTMVLSVNAQNSVVDEFKTDEPFESLYDRLILDPTKSIGENYAKIDSLMSLHRENDYAKYIIMVDGHYISKKYKDTYDWPLGMIEIKGEDNERYETISGQIIHVLTELYAHSLDEPFNVEHGEYHAMQVNEKPIKVETGRTFKDQNGKITKEYVTRKGLGNTFYSLYPTDALYKNIYHKVKRETNLTDKGFWVR